MIHAIVDSNNIVVNLAHLADDAIIGDPPAPPVQPFNMTLEQAVFWQESFDAWQLQAVKYWKPPIGHRNVALRDGEICSIGFIYDGTTFVEPPQLELVPQKPTLAELVAQASTFEELKGLIEKSTSS